MRHFLDNSKYLFYLLLSLLIGLIVHEFHFDQNILLYLLHIYIGIISVMIMIRKDCAMLTQASGVFFLIFFQFFQLLN